MSMRYNAVNAYGLILNCNVLNVIATKLYDDCTAEAWDKDKYDFIYRVATELDLQWISNFTGEALPIRPDGKDDYGFYDLYTDDAIYYIDLKRYPTLFEAPYKNMDDVVCELKSHVSKYLPDNFQYCYNIRHIIGTYYG